MIIFCFLGRFWLVLELGLRKLCGLGIALVLAVCVFGRVGFVGFGLREVWCIWRFCGRSCF